MKKSLKEQIERIHTLTYGKPIIKESVLQILLNEQQVQSTNDPRKADFVGKDEQGKSITNDKLVQDFYDTIQKSITDGGLSQQSHGSMVYQKEVESMQIALSLVGYQLPKYGIDGLFGPETAEAVQKFDKDNSITQPTTIQETAQDVENTLNSLGYNEKGNELDSGGQVTDNLSNIVDKILSDYKQKEPNVKITVTAGNDKFHQGLGYHSKHTEGNAIDLVLNPYNSRSAQSFKDILNQYKSQNSEFTYIDEYTNPSKEATAGHFHLQYGKNEGGGVGIGGGGEMTKATPEMLTKLLEMVKSKNLTPDQLKEFMNKNVRSGGSVTIDVSDWQGIINTIIDNLEGGYYHPDMLQDGRVKDSRFGTSGETMFGIDRKNGAESQSMAGQQFWKLIDDQDARHKWKHEYMCKDNPQLADQLRKLAAEMMLPYFNDFCRTYLSKESAAIVQESPALKFNFAYATYNGPGWFQKFANVMNEQVANGNDDPVSLAKIVLDRRINSGNSLIAQGGPKVANIVNKILSTSDTSNLA